MYFVSWKCVVNQLRGKLVTRQIEIFGKLVFRELISSN